MAAPLVDIWSETWFVCSQEHFAYLRHNEEKLSNAIVRFNETHSIALLNVKDLASLYQIKQTNEEGTNNSNVDDQLQWAMIKFDSNFFIAASKGKEKRNIFEYRNLNIGEHLNKTRFDHVFKPHTIQNGEKRTPNASNVRRRRVYKLSDSAAVIGRT